MQTFHEPIIGFVISKDAKEDYFTKILNELCEEELTKDAFFEYIENDKYTEYSMELENDRKMIVNFLDWLEQNYQYFELVSRYHGSAINTPKALVFKDSTKFKFYEYASYTVSIEDLEKILKEANKHKNFCKETMPTDLFNFLDDRDEFGLQYLCCSN